MDEKPAQNRRRGGWIERTEQWRRDENVAAQESGTAWVLRPPLGSVFAAASVLAAGGWVWSLASGGLEQQSLPIKLILFIAHVLVVATIVIEFGARVVARQRSRREDRRASRSRQDKP